MECLEPRSICVCKRTNTPAISQEQLGIMEKLTEDVKERAKLVNDKARLIALAKDLLKGADLLSLEENLIQPFLAIILRHVDTISEFKLTGDD
jgi:hypothetical protein